MVAIQMKAVTPKMADLLPTLRRFSSLRMYNVGQRMRMLYKLTVSSWKHKPQFEITVIQNDQQMGVTVGTDDKIFGYVDEGTKPHRIVPKASNPSKRLFFREGFSPKTQPGIVGSWGGGSFGNVVVAKAVNHPGTAARKFTQTIQKQTEKHFENQMRAAMEQTAEFVNRRSR